MFPFQMCSNEYKIYTTTVVRGLRVHKYYYVYKHYLSLWTRRALNWRPPCQPHVNNNESAIRLNRVFCFASGHSIRR